MLENYSYGDYVIVYNGQIYNTKELKDILVKNNFSFKGHSDTEVLLKSYIFFRKRCSKSLKWYFFFCYLEQQEKRIIYCKRSFWSKTSILYT